MIFTVRRFTEHTDAEILDRFFEMYKEGTLKQVFYDGQIQSAWDFLEYVRSGLIFGGFIYADLLPVACFWVSDISGNVGFFHYWTYKAAWGNFVYEVAGIALKYLATNTHLTGLCGRTPEHLKLAIRALKQRGFKILGIIPEAIKLHNSEIVGAVVSFFDLKVFKES